MIAGILGIITLVASALFLLYMAYNTCQYKKRKRNK